MEYRVKVNRLFGSRIDNIIDSEMERLEKRIKKKLTDTDKKKIKRKSLDMLDAQVRCFSTNKVVPVEEIEDIVLTNFTKLDDSTIYLNTSTRRGLTIKLEELEQTINSWLVDDLKIAVMYCTLGVI